MDFDESSDVSNATAADHEFEASETIVAADALDLMPIERNGTESLVFETFHDNSVTAEGRPISSADPTLLEGEYFHHHLLDAKDDPVRPAARRGGSGRHGEGRLGVPVGDGAEHSIGYGISGENRDPHLEGGFSVEDVEIWNTLLTPMARVDMTLMSCFYVGHRTVSELNGSESTTHNMEAMVKTFSPFYYRCSTSSLDEGASSEDKGKSMALVTLQRLASHMQSMQQALTEKGLMNKQCQVTSNDIIGAGGDASETSSHADERPPICRGAHSIHVDSACRLIGVIDVDVCAVSLADVIAFHARPLSQNELVAVVKSVVTKVALLHNAGVVHGCLHAGNVLCGADRGHTSLAGPCGIMSNPLFPADPSFISPRLAAAMQSLVDLISKGIEGGKVEGAFSWVEDPSFHTGILECFGCLDGSSTQPSTNDDVYAIGILTLTCALGVPPFCTAKLQEVVHILSKCYGSVTSSGDEKDVVSLLLGGELFSCDYTLQRMQLADYESNFVSTMLDFVGVCLRAGASKDAIPTVAAGDLLLHSFFTDYGPAAFVKSSMEGAGSVSSDEEADSAHIGRVLHCLFYPVSTALDCMKSDCGTTPFVPRLCRNSIFTARLNALQTSRLCGSRGPTSVATDNGTAVSWPYLDVKAPHWHTTVRNCTAEWRCELYATPSTLRHASCSDNSGCFASLKKVAKTKGMKVDTEARTLVWENRTGSRLILHRNDVQSGYLTATDTLILRNLQDCVVEVLLRFRYVVLQNVERCELLMGPCYFCYCDTVVDCPLVAVASAHLVTHDILRVNLRLGFCSPPSCRNSRSVWEEVQLAPYSIAYEGLSADYAAVPLPQEHIATVMLGIELESPELVKGTLELCNTLGRGQDYPYSHALAAFGNRFVHEDDGVSDVFLYPTEVRNKDIRIARVRGGSSSAMNDHERLFASDVTRLPLWRCRRDDTDKVIRRIAAEDSTFGPTDSNAGERFPIIFILDIVGDCLVEDCSNCAVIIIGSTEAITFRRCADMRLFVMGREVLLEECESMEVYVFATEMLMLTSCRDITLFPLAVRAPCIEDILGSIVESTVDETLREEFFVAFQQKDVITLNAITRYERDAGAIDLQACDNVQFDAACPLMFTVNFVPSDTEPSTLFFDAWQEMRDESEWVVIPLIEHAHGIASTEGRGSDNALPPVRFHDLVNVSIPRPSETLSGREHSIGASSQPMLVEVVFERIAMGIIHVDDVVETLFIRKCTGPLEIVVCAATRVIMESCEHVTVHTACCSFIAVDCHACRTSLHVNTKPQYINCTDIQASTASLTSHDYEVFLGRAGVLPGVNNFHEPVVHGGDASEISLLTPDAVSKIALVDSLEKAFAVLHSSVTLVPPPPSVSLGQQDAPLMPDMERRARHEETARKPFDANIVDALIFLSDRQSAECVDHTLEPSGTVEVGGVEEEQPLRNRPTPSSGHPHVDDSLMVRHVDPLAVDGTSGVKGSLLNGEEVNPASAVAEEDDDFLSHEGELANTNDCKDEVHNQSYTQSFDSTDEGRSNESSFAEQPREDVATASEGGETAAAAPRGGTDAMNSTTESASSGHKTEKEVAETRETMVSLVSATEEEDMFEGIGVERTSRASVASGESVYESGGPVKEFNVVVHPDEMELVSAAIRNAAKARADAQAAGASSATLMEGLHRHVEETVSWLRRLR
ncbi:tubulin binding cofactor c [Trypanosoma brucei equiperdum]|uniref:Tubulin binding cofactor c n=1 Tax=Trypanosoma brucei equiperdum TaxID=630700 RepID=A0A3L6L3E0_9TRYP|nr:tubulin binding cofactor c [Trypanosoma brucei equiperdum]